MRHGMRNTPTWRTWIAMRRRCHDPNSTQYEWYGARGIEVCERWRYSDCFVNFFVDMGIRPDGMTIDRIDNNRGYEIENCRWATHTTQVRNSRHTILTEEKVVEIREMLASGKSSAAISRVFKCHITTISKIKNGNHWR